MKNSFKFLSFFLISLTFFSLFFSLKMSVFAEDTPVNSWEEIKENGWDNGWEYCDICDEGHPKNYHHCDKCDGYHLWTDKSKRYDKCPKKDAPSNETVYCDICKEYHKVKWYHKLYLSLARDAYNGKLFSADSISSATDGNSDASFFNVEKILAFDVSKKDGDGVDKSFAELWAGIKPIYDSIMPVGMTLIVLFALLDMLNQVLQDRFSAEQMAKCFIKLALLYLFLYNAYDFITYAMNFCSIIFDKLKDGSVFNAGINDDSQILKGLIDSDGEMPNLIQTAGKILTVSITYLIMMIIKLVIRVIVWSRILNIVIYTLFAPIGMADMTKGTQSTGFRYFKKLVSLMLQGAVIYAIMIAYTILTQTVMSTGGSTVAVLISSFVVLTMMFRSESIAGSILGV